MNAIRIGSRGSQLAMIQARAVADLLTQRHIAVEIVPISTTGDRLAELPLSQVGGKGLFVKELEDALLQGTIDLAVHSSKDMSASLPDGLHIAAVLPREDPGDALVLRAEVNTAFQSIEQVIAVLGQSPRIGTSSVRRTSQLNRLWPLAHFEPIRGNLDTRLRKLDDGEYDGLVLAAAGLRRLGRADRLSYLLPFEVCLPAPGQGIVAIETRRVDARINALVAAISDRASMAALVAERAVVAALGGGCTTPIGALAEIELDSLRVSGLVASRDGERAIRHQEVGSIEQAGELGAQVAARLIADGAADILGETTDGLLSVEGPQS